MVPQSDDTQDDFPSERLRWLDDLLAELEKFSTRYELDALRRDMIAARKTLVEEAHRVNATPGHPIHNVRGLRDN